METKKLKQPKLPAFLPQGWRKEVAKVLGVHPLTITRNVRIGKGAMYERIVKTAAAKYGEKVED